VTSKFKLLFGKVRAAVKGVNPGNKNKFDVYTPNSVIGVRGTNFSVGFDKAKGATEVVAFEGKVNFKGALMENGKVLGYSKPVTLTKGQMAVVDNSSVLSPGKAPIPTKPKALATNLLADKLDEADVFEEEKQKGTTNRRTVRKYVALGPIWESNSINPEGVSDTFSTLGMRLELGLHHPDSVFYAAISVATKGTVGSTTFSSLTVESVQPYSALVGMGLRVWRAMTLNLEAGVVQYYPKSTGGKTNARERYDGSRYALRAMYELQFEGMPIRVVPTIGYSLSRFEGFTTQTGGTLSLGAMARFVF
jgi:hypothetical protein